MVESLYFSALTLGDNLIVRIKWSRRLVFHSANESSWSVSLLPLKQPSTCVNSVQSYVSFFFCHSPRKLLDNDDQYYRELPTSRSEPCVSAEGTTTSSSSRRRSFGQEQQSLAPAGRQTRERAVTEPDPHRPTRDTRSVLDLQSFLHLLGPYINSFQSLILLHNQTGLISSALGGLFLIWVCWRPHYVSLSWV